MPVSKPIEQVTFRHDGVVAGGGDDGFHGIYMYIYKRQQGSSFRRFPLAVFAPSHETREYYRNFAHLCWRDRRVLTGFRVYIKLRVAGRFGMICFGQRAARF
jgi:hypothetical protein